LTDQSLKNPQEPRWDDLASILIQLGRFVIIYRSSDILQRLVAITVI